MPVEHLSGGHTCVRRTVLGPPTSHVLPLHRGGALGGAARVLEASPAVKVQVLLKVRQTQLRSVRAAEPVRACRNHAVTERGGLEPTLGFHYVL